MISSKLYNRLNGLIAADPGITSDMHRIEELVSLVFLKISSLREQKLASTIEGFESIVPKELRWSTWAIPAEGEKLLTGPELIDYVNNVFIPGMVNLDANEDEPDKLIYKTIFTGVKNHMIDGYLMREVINGLEEHIGVINIDQVDLGNTYEKKLENLLSIGSAGQFYTPPPLTNLICELIDPQLNEVVADFACGTGGFLSSSLRYRQVHAKDYETFLNSEPNNLIYGLDKSPLAYMITVSTIFLHDISSPEIYLSNAFNKELISYDEEDKFDVILMDPPYGGREHKGVGHYFPENLRSNATSDMFLVLMMYRMKKGGRGAIILSDSFLFSNDNRKWNIKHKLFSEFNVHTIIRLPPSVFAPYSNIKTNILFFENTHPTRETWFYRVDMPKGYNRFTKRKPLLFEHLLPVIEWYNDKRDIIRSDGNVKAKKFSIGEIRKDDYKMNYCILSSLKTINSPAELIKDYRFNRKICNNEIDEALDNMERILNTHYYEL